MADTTKADNNKRSDHSEERARSPRSGPEGVEEGAPDTPSSRRSARSPPPTPPQHLRHHRLPVRTTPRCQGRRATVRLASPSYTTLNRRHGDPRRRARRRQGATDRPPRQHDGPLVATWPSSRRPPPRRRRHTSRGRSPRSAPRRARSSSPQGPGACPGARVGLAAEPQRPAVTLADVKVGTAEVTQWRRLPPVGWWPTWRGSNGRRRR